MNVCMYVYVCMNVCHVAMYVMYVHHICMYVCSSNVESHVELLILLYMYM